ncbi:ATP-dependent nuclease [Burkholderia pseudomallei]|uniref:ATP-dependent nuclease n=2 Tax=Burkholderia pseudomallei TaxID=28450 RepID=UPI00071813AB|nr:AAA family ATPase [Burkholderia pseudomallei]MBF4028492.1 AAA family ATPase [Burkholderia pseudomallei]OMT29281.1 ATP-dependent endonuclease [Burkholderia pseudomallei]OMT66794.1 ATP-dependent endonuclease [Burkholderia pseudomallei]CAJ2767345.1 ATP-dependent OLD family endonuclease [Burkholderia pseudomallei]CAJ2787501.1 ATP-dependent OLD family endonuclease [Burkholderia pseudomallei]
MRLRRFVIRNFKAIAQASFEWDELLVLIGENNCGKSTVLSALSYFLSGGSIRDPSLFRRHLTDAQNAIELTAHFDGLTVVEQRQVAVRGRMTNDEWVLKKKYWFEAGGNGDDPERGGWKEQLLTFSSRDTFTGWPETDTTWAAFPADYQPLIEQIANRGARPNSASRDALREVVRARRADLVVAGAPDWIPNPGGGGNWKSNANSIIPRVIFVRAVHEASDETNARDASTYGKLVNLIVERQLAQRPEMAELKRALEGVLQLFQPDDAHPERQATEIRELQERINQGLSEVIGGQAFIKTETPELRSLVMPSTSLVIRDPLAGIDTDVEHQGHGLQRTLVMTLLQLLAEAQAAPDAPDHEETVARSTILLVEEPELYLHPQMERLMRDVLYRLSSQPSIQIACCTHSPVFLDIATRYKSIVRLTKEPDGDVASHQVTQDIFPAAGDRAEREKLQTIARFHPTVNELFFAKHVVLFEEFSAIAAFERAAELTGLFERHRRLRREVTLVDCDGKNNITAFQRVLNAFHIPYRVLHDEDSHNLTAFAENARIAGALGPQARNGVHMVRPRDLEHLLGYTASKGVSKPFAAVKKVEELHNADALPAAFVEAMNIVYFGELIEPPMAT